VGILTSGGDCPGLNAVIRGAVLHGSRTGVEVVGIRDGWRGLLDADSAPLLRSDVRGIAGRGGTILGSSRTNPLDPTSGGVERILRAMDEMDVDGIIAVGGEGTLTVAEMLSRAGVKVIGVPKTIDNDISGTDYSFGFDTAVAVATEAIDRIRTTAESHRRCIVVEVMGRHVGWIALNAGVASGAHVALIPERPQSLETIAAWTTRVRDRGHAPIVVVSEGFRLEGAAEPHSHKGLDAFDRPRLGGIGELLAPMIEERTGIESRSTALGYLQRGGAPTSHDRVLATRLGIAAVRSAAAGDWGTMTSVSGTGIRNVPLADASERLNTVSDERYEEAEMLFG
jgi:6-phosphofructokinase 1